jgi:hypothetical protein
VALPQFDSFSSFATNQNFAGTVGGTWTHTFAGASGVVKTILIFVENYHNGQSIAGQTTHTLTLAGSTFTQVSTNTQTTNSSSDISCWIAQTTLTGAQSISGSFGSGTNAGRSIVFAAVAYTGVGAVFGSLTFPSTAKPETISLGNIDPNQLVVCGFGSYNQGSYSAFTGVTRRVSASSSDNFANAGVGDGPGTTGMTVTGTQSTAGTFGAIAVSLAGVQSPTQFFPFMG